MPLIMSHGSSVAYSDSGKGDTTLLFIHGWGIHKGYWEYQVNYFKDKFRVVAIDLPGYGESGNHSRVWGPDTYVQDLDSVIDALQLTNVILIGHSMSGATVVEAGVKHPGKFLGIVGVDNMKDVDMQTTPEMIAQWNQFYQAAKKDFKGSIRGGIDALFASTTDSLIRRRVTDDILASDTTMTLECLEAMDKYPFAQKLPQLKQPVFLIESAYVPTDTAAFTKLGVAYKFYDMGNVGHYPMLEDPRRFNSLLEQVIVACGKK
jgi:pimeloyl-ACP methyl ester carboxylesterase